MSLALQQQQGVTPAAWKAFGMPPSKRLKVRQLSDIVLSALLRPKLALAWPVGSLHWDKWDMSTVTGKLGYGGKKGRTIKGK